MSITSTVSAHRLNPLKCANVILNSLQKNNYKKITAGTQIHHENEMLAFNGCAGLEASKGRGHIVQFTSHLFISQIYMGIIFGSYSGKNNVYNLW